MLSKIDSEILFFFPDKIKVKLKEVPESVWRKATEIRIRVGQAILISCFDEEIFISYIPSYEDITRLIENFSDNSIYSIQNEINSGFITIKGRT